MLLNKVNLVLNIVFVLLKPVWDLNCVIFSKLLLFVNSKTHTFVF